MLLPTKLSEESVGGESSQERQGASMPVATKCPSHASQLAAEKQCQAKMRRE